MGHKIRTKAGAASASHRPVKRFARARGYLIAAATLAAAPTVGRAGLIRLCVHRVYTAGADYHRVKRLLSGVVIRGSEKFRS